MRAPPAATTFTAVVVLLSAVLPAVLPAQRLEKVATGFGFVEGPAWNPVEQHLLFSDIRNNKVMRLGAKDKVTVFLEPPDRPADQPADRANGLVFDRHGELYACLGGARQVVHIDPEGKRTVLAQAFGGKKLNSPNDLALDDDGGLYFTDPRYGKADDLEQDVMGVYHVTDAGVVTRVISDLGRPNGIVLTPDGSGLYVAVPDQRAIHYYPILAPGRLGKGRRIFQSDRAVDGGGPDGMAVDEHGHIYATYKNLLVLDGRGKLLERIPVPEKPSNCTIGGPESKTLYVTARTSLYRMKLDVRGAGDFVVKSWIGRRMLRLPKFATVEIDTKIGVGYGLSIADVDGDGKQDILLVTGTKVIWYENTGEPKRWPRHVIAEKLTKLDHVCIAARDIDGDGKAEIAVGAGWQPSDTLHSGSVHVLVPPEDRTKPWRSVALPHEPTVHRMRFVAGPGGRFDLVVAPLHGRGNRAGKGPGVKLQIYSPPGQPGGEWKIATIDDSLHVTHNFDPVQWDADPEEELLVASAEGINLFDRRKIGEHTVWIKTPLAGPHEGDREFRGAGEVRLARHHKLGGRLLATVEPFHGNTLVVYSPIRPGTPRKLWRRTVVLDDMLQGHAIACADFNRDGTDEIVVGWRRTSGTLYGVRLVMPHDARAGRTTRIPIDSGGMACEDLRIADLDGDGYPDIVAAGRATQNLRVYFNRTFQ
jgi:sugar lactone lactonase YvrE